MQKKILTVGLLFGVALLATAMNSSPTGSESATADFVPNQLVVWFQDEDSHLVFPDSCVLTAFPNLNGALAAHGLETIRPLFGPRSVLRNVFKLTFKADVDLGRAASEIRALPFVRSVTRNWIGRVHATIPDDYAFNNDWNNDGRPDQWHLDILQAAKAWDITTGSEDVVVCILDTGMDYGHVDLHDVIWQNVGDGGITSWGEDADNDGHTLEWDPTLEEWVLDPGDLNGRDSDCNGIVDDLVGYNFRANSPDVIHDNGGRDGSHGTVMGSLVSAMTDNSLGIAGISWHTRLMAVKVGSKSWVYYDAILGGLNYAIDNGADIVNMSFGGGFNDEQIQELHAVIQRGDSAGVLFVASAGDGDFEGVPYPARFPEVICAAAVDSTGHKDVSNYGADVDICAPSALAAAPMTGPVACIYSMDPTPECYPGSQVPHQFWFTGLYTSGAAAQVSGTLSLLKAQYPDKPSSFLKAELIRGGVPLPDPLYSEGKLGSGMLNIYRSLTQWGTISQNTTWSGTQIVSGDVTVASGVTLTLAPGTEILVLPDDNDETGFNTEKIEFNVEGSLDVQGTAENPVTVASYAGETLEDWVGFYLDSQSSGATFQHCVIKHAEIAIESWVSMTVDNAVVDSCRYYGIVVQDGSATVTNTTVKRSGAFGLFLGSSGTAQVSVTGSTFRDNVATAINVQPNATLSSVQSTEFRNNDTGVYFNDTATNYTINNSCVFKGNNVAIYSSGYVNPAPQIVSCVIDSNGTGVQTTNYSHPELTGNQMMHNDAGVLAENWSTPRIRSNVLKYNDDAVLASTDAEPDVGTYASAGNNTIQYSTNYHIVNLSPFVTVYAINNWYGSKGPKSTKFLGDVVWEPYLTGDDPNAAPDGNLADPEVDERTIAGSGIVACVPNPMNPTTSIRYELASPDVVDISVYNVRGQLVRHLVHGPMPAGTHVVGWDGFDDSGGRVASSVYFVKLTTGRMTETMKLTVLK